MPRFTAAAFWSGRSAGRRWRKGATRDQLPGIAASIATMAPLELPLSARTKARTRPAAGSPFAEQRRERLERSGLVAADRQAQRETAAGLVGVRAVQGRAVIGLRLLLLAEQIVRQPAIASDLRSAAPSCMARVK